MWRIRIGMVLMLALLACLPVVNVAADAGVGDDKAGTLLYTFPDGVVVYPEGIAYHPGTGDFFVGSTADGTVYRGNVWSGKRSLEPFLPGGADGRGAALGMKVDQHGFLWIAGGPTGTIWMYDAVTGRFLSSFYNGVAGSFINDVAIAPDGAAYFTDSAQPYLYRVAANAQGVFTYELWLDLHNTIIPYDAAFNLNGISATGDGRYLIAVHSATGELFRIATASKEITRIDVDTALTAGDGILLDGHTLYVVRNQFAQIAKVELSDNFSSGKVVDTLSSSTFRTPTTITKVGDRLLVVNSQFGARATQNPVLPFTISSVPLMRN